MKWIRHKHQICKPLGVDGKVVSGSAEHIALSRQAAAEGIVLLRNQARLLPLAQGTKVVLLGKGSEEYVKGGGGSGDVAAAYVRSLYEGMKQKEAEGKVNVYEGLHDFYAQSIRTQYEAGQEPGMTREPTVSEKQLVQAAACSDIAILSICRFSGEGWDRRCNTEREGVSLECESWEGENRRREAGETLFPRGDFYLTEEEQALFLAAKQHFTHLVVVLNVGGIFDTEWFQNDEKVEAVLFAGQGGMEGGLACADILCGDVVPSGHLTDTFAKSLADYPSTANFHDSPSWVEYTEDVYVGYRWFETIAGMRERVNYPFGFGLSYTAFSVQISSAVIKEDRFICLAEVTNTGVYAGKEVLQLYYAAPQGKLGKPARELAAFAKTHLLQPEETTQIALEFSLRDMASYDDTGAVCKSAWVLEKGTYHFYLGSNVRDAMVLEPAYILEDDVVVCQLAEKLKPRKLTRRLRADGSYEVLPQSDYEKITRPAVFDQPHKLEGISPETRPEPRETLQEHFHPTARQFIDVAEGRLSLDQFMEDMTTEEMVWLLGGQPSTGVANTFGMGNNRRHGVPNIMTADGPAGLRILPHLEICTTAWPCATTLACAWNTDLVQQVGEAAALEVKENNIGIWLAPGMNIHRSPLCGRNFEYYSEDPVLTGEMGAAMILGVQSQHIAATPKHFALNNKETNRKHSDSRVSERAAREIYLKGFEIAVKKADPWLIMSSYNMINGVYASENRELLTDILRDEWGFNGIVTTDWWTRAEHWREVKAGNDVKMANGYPEELLEALSDGRLTEEDVRICAKHVLAMILKMD